MAHDHVAATEVEQHLSADFTRKCAVGVLAEVLRAPGDARIGQQRLDLGEIRKRHAHRRLDRQVRALQRLQQFAIGGQSAVHLPVSRHKHLPHRPASPEKRESVVPRRCRGQ